MDCAAYEPSNTASVDLATLLATTGPSHASSERVLTDLQLLLTTNVCIESGGAPSPLDRGSWFRFGQRRAQSSFCRATPRSKPQVTVGVAGGGRWRAGTSFGGVVRCPNSSGLSAFTMPAHDYCTGPAPNAYVLPHRNETSWLRGVTLIANERHIDNFNITLT